MGKKADKRAGPQAKEAEARVPALQEKLKGTNPDHFKETEKDFKGRLELANVEKEQFTLKKQAKNKQEHKQRSTGSGQVFEWKKVKEMP